MCHCGLKLSKRNWKHASTTPFLHTFEASLYIAIHVAAEPYAYS